MDTLEALAFRLATDPDFRARFAVDPECAFLAEGLALDEPLRSTLNQLQPLLALSAEALADRLIGEVPAEQWRGWGAPSALRLAAV